MEVKIVKAFIASPSDTENERVLCDKIFNEINSSIGNIYNFRLESLKWENDVRPIINGKDGQSTIFEQIGSEFELFIGIMNKKFGSPTPRAGSGTEEEFNEAYKRYEEKRDLEVMFYFNEEPPKIMSEVKASELLKIENFRKRLQPIGIYGVYNGINDFEEKLRKHLTKYFLDQFKKKRLLSDEQLVVKESLKLLFKKRFNDSLKGFDDQPKVWIEPVISRTSEISQNPDENFSQRVLIEEILFSDKSYVINAPAQFGLTTLGHHLICEAWENDELWIYLDNASTKPHTIHNAVKKEVESLEQAIESVKCIVFDSFLSKDKVSLKKLKNLVEGNPNLKIVVLNTTSDSIYVNKKENDTIDEEDLNVEKDFEFLHLIALPRTQIRSIVNQYNSEKKICEENLLLNKITKELESLNLHRTPYNIITILKVSEKNFDDSPVNRTRLIEMILFVLFDLGELPTYKTRPDLRDSEYVLGRYCELMLRNEKYTFSKDEFVQELKAFCEERYMNLDIDVVFDILRNNNIIIFDYGKYRFKSSFWIYYFGAKRMHNNEVFRDYIFSSKKYSAYPEIIEFYTGIDRNRDDALKVLLNDIVSTKTTVENKLGINGDINPLHFAKWKPAEDAIKRIHDEIGENVLTSNLPDTIKDQFLDKSYNQIRPYNQSIQKIFEDYSLHNLMQQIRAASTALRNSDYSSPILKQQLLIEIYSSWHQLTKTLFALAPIMAANGKVAFEGAEFTLSGDFGETPEIRLNRIIQVVPTNVVGFFQDDLYSSKIAPLFYERFENEKNELMKHHQALLLIFKRPNGWKAQIQKYMTSINKNSFYLYDVVNALRGRYRYDFCSQEDLSSIKFLIKLGTAKHLHNGGNPTMAEVVRINDSNLPKRELLE